MLQQIPVLQQTLPMLFKQSYGNLQKILHVPNMCQNCIHFDPKGNLLYDFCKKFQTKCIFARSPQGKCGINGSHFEFKDFLK